MTPARRLAAYLLEHGSHGLVIAGVNGRVPDPDRRRGDRAAEETVRAEVGDEVLIICGTGTNDTRHSLPIDADGGWRPAPTLPWSSSRTTTSPIRLGIRAHFETVAGAVPELPMVMYNIPSRVVINAGPELLGELGQVDNIVALKQANDDELGPIEGLTVLAGNYHTPSFALLEFGGGGGITRRLAHRRRSRCARCGRRRRLAISRRARQIDAEKSPRSTEATCCDHQPDSAQGRAGDARPGCEDRP